MLSFLDYTGLSAKKCAGVQGFTQGIPGSSGRGGLRENRGPGSIEGALIALNSGQIETEVAGCIIVADVAYHRADQPYIVGDQAPGHVRPEQVAEDSAEVLVAAVAEETAAVGDHAHKVADGCPPYVAIGVALCAFLYAGGLLA